VRVSLSGRLLGRFTPGAGWSAHTLDLPAGGDGPPRLRLDVVDPVTLRPRTWRPARSLPGSDDTRDIGVKVDRIEIERGPANIVHSASGGTPSS
jgi:hypothetical protein